MNIWKGDSSVGQKKRGVVWRVMLAAVCGLILWLPGQGVSAAEYTNPVLPIQEPVYDEETGTLYLGEDQIGLQSDERDSGQSVSHWGNSKKGLQENEYLMDMDYQALGVKHVLINIVLSNSVAYADGSYYLADQADAIAYLPLVEKLNAEGVTVTAVLLYRWTDDPNLQNLIYPGARTGGQSYYNLNCEDDTGRTAWKNIFDKLVSMYGQSNCHIDHWILGNEVNQTGNDPYNYTGSNDLDTNVRAYGNVFKVLNQSIADNYASAKSFISFDHNWTGTDTGLPGKAFLDAFASYMGSGQWGVAWHPYAPCLDSDANTAWENKVIWNSPGVTNNINTRYICGSNLTVLTNYIKNNWGSSHRVLLSEQGYDASGSDAYQAAFIAYTYYAAQFNDMVDGVMFRAYLDNPDEGGLKLGLINGTLSQMEAAADRRAYVSANKRPAYDVFKYMDTDEAGTYTANCLQSIGAGEWKELISAYSGPANKEYWLQEGSSWYLVKGNSRMTGWVLHKGVWYYLKPEQDGAMATGMFKAGGVWYCADGSGVMQSGGWKLIGGSWYYLQSNGAAYTGWLRLGNIWYYMDPSTAAMRTGWIKDGAVWYYLDGSGAMQSGGWRVFGGSWYYLQPGGAAYTGWLRLGNIWYYMDPSTAMMRTGWIKDGAAWYYLDGSGAMQSGGWKLIGGSWYYLQSNGAAYTGWLRLGSTWYYLDPSSAAMHTGWIKDGAAWYYLEGSGAMQSGGWRIIGGNWYYLQGNGAAYTGWLRLGNVWYYLDPSSAAMHTGWIKDGNIWYYLDGSGAMRSGGWNMLNGEWYWLESSGAMRTGWFNWQGAQYYLDPSRGAMVTGEIQIDGKRYLFDASGRMQ
jgi:glucan-binding YG repeat protein